MPGRLTARSRVAVSLLLITSFSSPSPAVGEEELSPPLRAIVETPLVVQVEVSDPSIEVRRDLPYTADGTEGPRLDVYHPSAPAEDGRPVLLFVHGGPLPPGSFPEPILHPKDWQFYRDYGRLAAARGFVALVPDYRFHTTAEIATAFSDLRAALDWLKTQAEELGADTDRLGIWLFSGAGAHLGWLTEAAPEVRATVAFYPVAAFKAFVALGLGETPPEITARWDPVTHVDASLSPLLVARAGKDDPAINASIDAFVDAAIAAGVTLDLLLHPEGQHGFDVRDDLPRSRQLVDRAFEFFEENLESTRLRGPSPPPAEIAGQD